MCVKDQMCEKRLKVGEKMRRPAYMKTLRQVVGLRHYEEFSSWGYKLTFPSLITHLSASTTQPNIYS